MRYIKVFENAKYKFKNGDYVRYSNYSYKDREKVYTIIFRQKKYNRSNEESNVYSIDAIDGSESVSWVFEWELQALSNYEIVALKYNL